MSLERIYKKAIGIIVPHGYKNRCCEDKPFILYGMTREDGRRSYNCRCECDFWCTSGHGNPVDAIMEYELMCRVYPEPYDFGNRKIYENYMKYYHTSLITTGIDGVNYDLD